MDAFSFDDQMRHFVIIKKKVKLPASKFTWLGGVILQLEYPSKTMDNVHRGRKINGADWTYPFYLSPHLSSMYM